MKYLALLLLFPTLANAADLYISWTAPPTRDDGTPIESIDGYNIYYSINNGEQTVLPVVGENYLMENVSSGLYTVQISAVEEGIEGEKSSPVSVRIAEKQKAKPGRVVITVDFVNCDDCGLELQ